MANQDNQIFSGNLETDPQIRSRRGWFIGHFADAPLKTESVEVKYSSHPSGESKSTFGTNKTAKSFAFLVKGKIKYTFPDHNRVIILEKVGDFVFFDAGVAHSWEALEDCNTVTFRWPSIPGDQEAR